MNIKAVYFSKTSTFTAEVKYDLYGVNSSGGAVTVNLPAAADVPAGKTFIIKDVGGQSDSNNITIDPAGSDIIDGAATYAMDHDKEGITLVCNGTNGWVIISRVRP